MGTYRLVLALVVAFAHAGGTVAGWSAGVSAVISFFIISGLAMTALISSDFNISSRVNAFYFERTIRLFPQFVFYLVLTLIIVTTQGVQSDFVSRLTVGKILLNFLVIPLNFFMFADLFTGMLIPQAWSLGLEVIFYLAFPWLLLNNLRLVAMIFSFGIFTFAYFNVLNPDNWAYRFLPGVLFIFLLGSYIHKSTSETLKLLALAWTVMLLMFLGLLLFPQTQRPYLLEVLVGILIGLPIVVALHDWRGSSIDKFMGNISYGVFLNHFAVLWLMQSTSFGWPKEPFEITVFLFICTVLGVFSYLAVERPLLIIRRRVRLGKGNETVNANKILGN